MSDRIQEWFEGYMGGIIVATIAESQWCVDDFIEDYKRVKKEYGWMRNRECMYCQSMFDCKERPETEYCLNFTPRDTDAEERYKEWRQEHGKAKKN